MKKASKRFHEIRKRINQNIYPTDEALRLVKECATAKFSESVEAHISLNINPKYANQQLRTSLVLPNGTGKAKRIAVLTETEQISTMLQYGATIAGAEDLIEEITLGKLNFDLLITTPEYMPKLAKLGKILGPKGLMPSPKSGTVSQNLKETIAEFKKGKMEYRADKTGIVHINFGNVSFSENQLKENLLAVYQSIEKNKPAGVKGKYFKFFTICSTMGPGIPLLLASLRS
ncbi:MAG: 50S ribosomal protein L1 [Pedobacter sp.]|nr:MAG: 50S ribosomal protein L1 [Pedobacter sp.]